uniref:Carbohydrate sulfotransferase 11 n=1 Tax=Cairina moschata TaxID=8855 RepID=A0A8C3C5U9_CAIMO
QSAATTGSLLRGLGAPSRTEPPHPPPPAHPLAPGRCGGSPSRQPGASPPAAAAGRDHLSPRRGGGTRSAPAPRPARLPPARRRAPLRLARRVVTPSAGISAPRCGARAPGHPPERRRRLRLLLPGSALPGSGTGYRHRHPAASSAPHPPSLPAPPGSAMKPAVLEVMRMNRVCRMVLVTSVGSFILVIFYFQIMRRNPFGMDICCRKGSRSPLQELYNPTQKAFAHFLDGALHATLSAVGTDKASKCMQKQEKTARRGRHIKQQTGDDPWNISSNMWVIFLFAFLPEYLSCLS